MKMNERWRTWKFLKVVLVNQGKKVAGFSPLQSCSVLRRNTCHLDEIFQVSSEPLVN